MPDAQHIFLLVDDDESLRSTASMMLNTFGHDVVTVEDGESALALLEENPDRFDLILTDLTMPDMNGRELARKAKANGTTTPFVLVTGYMVDDSDCGEEFIGCLVKPFRMQQMQAKIEEFLARANS